MNVRDGPQHGCGGDHSNTRHLLQAHRDGVRASDARELAVNGGNTRLKTVDFLNQVHHRLPQRRGQTTRRVVEDPDHTGQHGPGPGGDRVPLFAEQPADDIDPTGPGGLPLCAHPMQRLQHLLVDRLHWHCVKTGTTIRLEHRFSVRAIRLVASHVRAGGRTARAAIAP